MKRVLVLYYSQSGQVEKAVAALSERLAASTSNEIVTQSIEPLNPYPYPWGSALRFFDVLPETVLNLPDEDHPLEEPIRGTYDLIIFAYPVWFLMPALPTQAVLRDADFLTNTNVVTLCVCRGMWHHAATWTNDELRRIGARLRGHVVVTHQGPSWATFITVPRQLIFGKNERLSRHIPAAGVGDEDLQRLSMLGGAIAERVCDADLTDDWLEGHPAARVDRNKILPELIAWPIFRTSGRILNFCGRRNSPLRKLGLVGFMLGLICLILVAMPVTVALSMILRRMLPRWFEQRAAGLERNCS